MKIRHVSVDAVSTCINYGYDREEWVGLRKHAEVLSWFLSLAARNLKVELPHTNSLTILAAEPPFSPEIRYLDRKAFVAIEANDPDFLATQGESRAVYEFLSGLALSGFSLVENKIGVDLSALSKALQTFFERGCVCRHTLASRRPRGLGVEFRLKAKMTERLLQVDFAIYDAKSLEEIYCEAVIKTFPSQTQLIPKLGKIQFNGSEVWLEGEVPRPRSQEDIDNNLGSYGRDDYYCWSRNLQEILF